LLGLLDYAVELFGAKSWFFYNEMRYYNIPCARKKRKWKLKVDRFM